MVRILDYKGKKIRVIKLIRNTFNIELKEALMISNQIPSVLFQLSKKDADQFVQTLNELDIPYNKKSIHYRNGQSQCLAL